MQSAGAILAQFSNIYYYSYEGESEKVGGGGPQSGKQWRPNQASRASLPP